MSQTSNSRPPFDSAYRFSAGVPGWSDALNIETLRQTPPSVVITGESLCVKYPQLAYTDLNIPALEELSGKNTIDLTLFRKKDSQNSSRAALLFMHGGGQIVGDRFAGIDLLLASLLDNDDIVIATVEFRLAPEDPAPAGAYDCYSATTYLYEHAAELGIDSSRIALFGTSGGAALAAATCFLARKRQHPPILAQILNIPMLDDGDEWPSVKQFETGTVWPGKTNRQAWDFVLGSDRREQDIDGIRCPGRATDLSNLPPAYIDVGQCEVFRDAAVAYASRIWQCGGSAELHVWPGVYHGAIVIEPNVAISRTMRAALKEYIQRTLGLGLHEKASGSQL
ncbi:alpha/beta-hydrolase [Dothidotthia symphoricarpi CBS 119687]|uniref:Alpha/beta-hydrolase n=1 Tax=Dothidotthia symphoricarpi CBS 119687 TaxID=1392245 RepID=A0A6A6AHB1_9PLEO|nr:alpha/beta-hydrolase [Dothidotthia symphoricarpi CBS 119687]KAF2130458.1 alpha/beta-hydrolase [Dothidotthia symphoricarpi CBS 119687]